MATSVSDSVSLRILNLNISGLRSKTNHVSLLIVKYKPDFILLQETNVDNDYLKGQVIESLKLDKDNCFFNYNTSKSNGTCILQTSNKWEITSVKFCHEGRVTIVKIRSGKHIKTMINVYAPSNPTQRVTFYDELFKTLTKNKSENCVIAGDFNITLHDIDIFGISGKQRRGRRELLNIIQMLNAKDSFRTVHPDKREFTYENTSEKRASRIDHVYVNVNSVITSIKHLPETLLFTDHKGVLLDTGNNIVTKETGHWIFNNTLLENAEFIQTIEDIISNNSLVKDKNFLNRYEQMKHLFKNIAIRYGSKINKEKRKKESLLEMMIIAFEKKKIKNNEYERLKLELEEIKTQQYRGAFIRSKLPITQEKPTKAFLSLESSIQKSRIITEINDKSGKKLTEKALIKDAFQEFYCKLYEEEETNTEIQDYFLNFTRKLSEEEKKTMRKSNYRS